MMYGPSKGMAMGGEVKGYAGPDGSLVGSDEYLIEGQPVSKEEYDAYLAALDEYNALSPNEKAMVDQRNRLDARMAQEKEPEIKFYTGPNGERLTEDDVRMMMRRGEVGETFTRTDNEMRRQRAEAARREEAERQRRIEEDGPRQNAAEAALTALSEPFSAAGRGIASGVNTIGSGINKGLTALTEEIIPEVGQYLTDRTREGITALQNRVAEQERQRAFNAEQAQADAIGMRPPTREQALRELLQPLMDRKQSVDNAMTDIAGAGAGQGQSTVQTQGAGQLQGKTPPPPPEEGGIRSALTKAKPVASKIAGVLEVLGRGAGASKGFEGAKIVEESRKLSEAQADREARLAEQKALLEARKEELDARNAVAMNMSAAEYAAQLTDDAIMMSDEFAAIEERLKDEAGFFMNADEKESIRRKLAEAIKTIRQRKLSEYQSYLKGNLPGVSGQGGVEGAGERIIESADFF